MLYIKDSKISEPIFKDPTVITVLNRCGIYLGVGELSIEETCREHNIDSDLFLAILNTYMDSNYYPVLKSSSDYLAKVVDYLEKTDIYYRDVQLMNIDRHFEGLLRSSAAKEGTNGNIELLNRFYQEVKEELQLMIQHDLEYWFPILREAICNADEKLKLNDLKIADSSIPLPFRNVNLEDKIKDLICFFIIHLKGDYNRNLCLAVVNAILMLEKDVCQNNRIRERILRPLCEA